MVNRLFRKSKFLFAFLRSWLVGAMVKHRYTGIQSFILFVGYPRSGHSLVAAILDAHPEIVISMEWGVLSHLQMGYRKYQIYYSIERYARLFTRKLKNIWTGYSYEVQGQWQGRFKTIRLIGDKLAGKTSLILQKDPSLLYKLQQTTGCPVRIIHVIRNPYDTITTMARRSFEKSGIPDEMDRDFLLPFIKRYFDRAATVRQLKEKGEFEILDLYHEDLITDPRYVLEELLYFLGAGISEDYLSRCSATIYKEPHKSRQEFDWPEDLKAAVRENLGNYSFLEHYSFED
jgi:hypothetical protein